MQGMGLTSQSCVCCQATSMRQTAATLMLFTAETCKVRRRTHSGGINTFIPQVSTNDAAEKLSELGGGKQNRPHTLENLNGNLNQCCSPTKKSTLIVDGMGS